jgi:hypothetical protein
MRTGFVLLEFAFMWVRHRTEKSTQDKFPVLPSGVKKMGLA